MGAQNEARQRTTERIVEALKNGIVPWVRPWSDDPNCGPPRNVVSKNPYRGINHLLLSLTASERRYGSRWWGTYRQWGAIGGQVRRRPEGVAAGEWGTTVVYYESIRREKTADDGRTKVETFPLLKSYTIFNLDQVDGPFDRLRPGGSETTVLPAFDEAESVVRATGADVRHGGNEACYHRPVGTWPHHSAGDCIRMPFQSQFAGPAAYFATMFHELTHWTECRLGWIGSYALGELRAELGACFLAAEVGIPGSTDLANHASYLGEWLRVLGEDHRAVFRIAAEANRACGFVLSCGEPGTSSAVPAGQDATEKEGL